MRCVVADAGSDPCSDALLTMQIIVVVDVLFITTGIRSPDHGLALCSLRCGTRMDSTWHKGTSEAGAEALGSNIPGMVLLLPWPCG